MTWYNNQGKDSDVVVSSRVRIARNISGYPFSAKLTEQAAKELTDRVRDAVGDGYTYTDCSALSATEAASFVEKNIVSEEFTAIKTQRALLQNEKTGVDISVGGEDHIRAQCIKAGAALEDALAEITALDNILDSRLDIAFNEKLGYLTASPADLGTAMRASVMLFLPGLTSTRELLPLQSTLGKLGLTLRSMRQSGDNALAESCLYLISNSATLGVTESETVGKLVDITAKITEREREIRNSVTDAEKLRLHDKVSRSLGTLAYAELMDYTELTQLYCNVRLDIAMGMCGDISYCKLDSMLFEAKTATLALKNTASDSDKPVTVSKERTERDSLRAAYTRSMFAAK